MTAAVTMEIKVGKVRRVTVSDSRAGLEQRVLMSVDLAGVNHVNVELVERTRPTLSEVKGRDVALRGGKVFTQAAVADFVRVHQDLLARLAASATRTTSLSGFVRIEVDQGLLDAARAAAETIRTEAL